MSYCPEDGKGIGHGYTDAFGEGAIVFSLGCSEEVKISGVTMCFLERVKPNYKILPK